MEAESTLPLTLEALVNFTKQHPASPRKTVHSFLQTQKGMKYPLKILSTAHAPTPAPDLVLIRHPRSPPEVGPETALVMGRSPEGDDLRPRKVKKESGRANKEDEGQNATRRKHSVVAAMRPRLSSAHAPSPSINSQPGPSIDRGGANRSRDTSEEARLERRNVGQGLPRLSSPLLIPRSSKHSEKRRPRSDFDDKRIRIESIKENTSPVSSIKGKGKGKEVEIVVVASKKSKRRPEEEPVADPEHVERLEARKERRRAKALIVKDHTVSAAATGAAAASKVKKAKKKQREEERKSDDETSEEEPKRKKKKRTGAEQTNLLLQQEKRAKNVVGSRLTLRPAAKYGLFNKGAASVKTRIGQRLPDLAFSELAFLNAPPTRPRPPSSSPSASSSEPSPPPRKNATKDSNTTGKKKDAVTYGNKSKKASSKYFGVADFSSSSSDAPPPAKAKSKKKKAEKNQSAREEEPVAVPKGKRKKQADHVPASSVDHAVVEVESTSNVEMHSAYSLRQRKAPSAQPSSTVISHLSVPEAVMDTSNAFKLPKVPAKAVNVAPPRSASPEVQSPTSIDLLIRMADTGEPDPRVLGRHRDTPALEELVERSDSSIQPCDEEPIRDSPLIDGGNNLGHDAAFGFAHTPQHFEIDVSNFGIPGDDFHPHEQEEGMNYFDAAEHQEEVEDNQEDTLVWATGEQYDEIGFEEEYHQDENQVASFVGRCPADLGGPVARPSGGMDPEFQEEMRRHWHHYSVTPVSHFHSLDSPLSPHVGPGSLRARSSYEYPSTSDGRDPDHPHHQVVRVPHDKEFDYTACRPYYDDCGWIEGACVTRNQDDLGVQALQNRCTRYPQIVYQGAWSEDDKPHH